MFYIVYLLSQFNKSSVIVVIIVVVVVTVTVIVVVVVGPNVEITQ